MAPIPQVISSILSLVSSTVNAATGTTPTHTLSLNAVNNDLPAPSSSTPLYIGIGLGTQNYTCSASGATAISAGAYARLYSAASASNLDGITNDYVQSWQTMGCKAGDLTCADTVNLLLYKFPTLGEHFFTASTPTFNLDGSASQKHPDVLFATVVKKVTAPSDAYAGANGDGAVQWLYLDNDGSGRSNSDASYVYRVQTAGGEPPTCTQQGTVQIPYSAQYWFYA